MPQGYRERISHPAFEAPLAASGTLERRADGTLVRTQEFPEYERIEISTGTIVMFTPDGGTNLYPHGKNGPQMLASLEALSGDRAPVLLEWHQAALTEAEDGWIVELRPDPPTGAYDRLALTGCGAQLLRILIDQGVDGTREILLEPKSGAGE